MCLIIVKKKGIPLGNLYKSIARSYGLRNRDGFGFAIKRGKRVYISKGYFNLDSFINAIKSHYPKKSDEILVHLRKVSAGERNINNCHPYICSDDHDTIMKSEGFVENPILAHNGTFQNFKKHNSDHSDTYFLIKEFVNGQIPNVINHLNKIDKAALKRLLFNNDSRLAIMHPSLVPITLTGKWEEVDGLLYSNKSYLGKTVTTTYEYYGQG